MSCQIPPHQLYQLIKLNEIPNVFNHLALHQTLNFVQDRCIPKITILTDFLNSPTDLQGPK